MSRKIIALSFLAAVMAVCNLTASAADYEVSLDTLSHIRGTASDVAEMTLSLSNASPISAIQFDVTLPNCATFGYPEMWIDDNRSTRSHALSINKLSGYTNKYRVLIASSTAKDLKGNSGPLVHMSLQLSSTGSYSGNYYVQVTNVIASESDETQHTIASANGVVRYGYIVGDANGDATVDVADYMATASKILGNSPSPFYNDAANVDSYASIDVADLVGIANISLGTRPLTVRFPGSGSAYTNAPTVEEVALPCNTLFTASSKRGAALAASSHDRLYIEDFSISAGETVQVPVLLLNDTAYSGLQTDLYLPQGLSVDLDDDEYIIDLTSRKDYSHTVSSYRQGDGAIRIYIASMSAKAFNGNDGPLFTVSITAADTFHGQASIQLRNTIAAESIGTKHVLPDEVCIVDGGGAGGLTGDADGNGEIGIADVVAIIDYILWKDESQINLLNADVDGDGTVGIADAVALIDMLLN